MNALPNNRDGVSIKDLYALGYIFILPSIFQSAPGPMAKAAGSVSWAAALLGIVPFGIYAFFIHGFMNKRKDGEGLSELMLNCLGAVFGRVFLVVNVLWFTLKISYTIYSGAVRFVSIIYPNASALPFMCAIFALVVIAGFGRVSTLARASARMLPVLTIVIVFVFALALPGVDWLSVLPVSTLDTVPMVKGALRGFEGLSTFVVIAFHFRDAREKTGTPKRFVVSAIILTLTLSLTCLCVQGYFGEDITRNLQFPFFSMFREISLFNTLDRFESLLTSIWVMGDFFLCSSLLLISSQQVQLVFNCPVIMERGKLMPMFRGGRWTVWLCVMLITVGLVIFSFMNALNYEIITIILPMIRMIFVLGMVPLGFIVGKIRKLI